MGRREARPRLAHFLSEVLLRQRANGLASSGSFVFPLTQVALADILGLSPVHINRLIQGLRRDGLIERRGTRFEVLDWERLQVIADFDPAYLRLDR